VLMKLERQAGLRGRPGDNHSEIRKQA
jgi:hypothetical protein